MAKTVRKTSPKTVSRLIAKGDRTAGSAAASAVPQRSAKSGRFSEGIAAVSRRNRTGLIKLADR